MGNRPPTDAIAIDVRFVPLPLHERDERGRQLRTLLLRGALRAVQQHTHGQPQAVGASSVTGVQR
jgi:hypothetical protein